MLQGLVARELKKAGITIGGHGPLAIRVRRKRFYRRLAILNSLGLGQAYMQGDFECDDIYAILNKLMEYLRTQASWFSRLPSLPEMWIRLKLMVPFVNAQKAIFAKRDISYHYDAGNDWYKLILDPSMTYSCGYWEGVSTLEDAQASKHEHTCRKVCLRSGMHVIEIGCGWGGLAGHILKYYPGVTLVCITYSMEQCRFCLDKYKKEIDEGRVQFHYMDYREIPEKIKEKFDAVISIGMFEHVGPGNYDNFFDVVNGCAKPGAYINIHSIFGNGGLDAFIWYYIFPGGFLPMEHQVMRAALRRKLKLKLMNVDNFGPFYATTLGAWKANLRKNWDKLLALGHSEMELLMTEFYFAACQVGFVWNYIQLEQLVFLKLPDDRPVGVYPWNRPRYFQKAA